MISIAVAKIMNAKSKGEVGENYLPTFESVCTS